MTHSKLKRLGTPSSELKTYFEAKHAFYIKLRDRYGSDFEEMPTDHWDNYNNLNGEVTGLCLAYETLTGIPFQYSEHPQAYYYDPKTCRLCYEPTAQPNGNICLKCSKNELPL